MVYRKHLFDLPEGMIYLDGNSLGPLARGVPERIAQMVQNEWGAHLIKGWNMDGWMTQPGTVADRIGRLIGAPAGWTVLGDTLSVKVYQALSAALTLRPDRREILTDSGNFPSDLYVAQGLIRQLGQGHVLKVVAPEAVADAISAETAAVMLTQVDYRSGRLHDMTALTAAAHAAGAVMIWDLAHSAGAVEVDFAGSGAEFAVGCTYKYLNGGPGAPAFITARPDVADKVAPAIAGWLGHARPFDFDATYEPAPGIDRFRIGTPPVVQMAALAAALDVWDDVDMADVRAASIDLTEQFIAEAEAKVPDVALASPRAPHQRGSQVSFRCEQGYAAMQALIAQDVIGDFRAPNLMRFGFTPLFVDADDVSAAVDIWAKVMRDRLWDDPAFRAKKAVT